LAIRGELEAASVTSALVACEGLLAVEFEVTFTIVDYNFIIHGLPSEVLAIRMHGGGWDGVHVWLRDMLGHHRDSELPHIHFLVIGGRHKPATILDKSECVN